MTRQEYIRISQMLDELDIIYSDIARLRTFVLDGTADGELIFRQGARAYDITVDKKTFGELVQKFLSQKLSRQEMLEKEFENL